MPARATTGSRAVTVDDTLNGGPGRDLIFAQRGVDTVYGGGGNDDLWALARRDVTHEAGEPADTVDGGAGNDRIHVRDGEADTVTCGAGFDVVRADFKDKVATDCERVRRNVAARRTDDDARAATTSLEPHRDSRGAEVLLRLADPVLAVVEDRRDQHRVGACLARSPR